MASALLSCLGTTDALAEIFSDESVLQAMLDFESALARAEARVGVIPQSAADAIVAAAHAGSFDAAEIARLARSEATLAIPLVKLLRERSSELAHHGAAGQDLCDTAMVLLLRRARPILASYQQGLTEGLRKLAHEHGLKAAHWFSAVQASWRRFDARFDEALLLQFGGPGGTLAELGDQALAVSDALAVELGLANPPTPWPRRRDRIAAIVCSGAIYVGVLGKLARDISLLLQAEVGCAVTLAAATRMPGIASSFLSAMVQEHEGAVGEWLIVSEAVQTIGAAISAMAGVVQTLEVFPERMKEKASAGPLGMAEHFRRRLMEE